MTATELQRMESIELSVLLAKECANATYASKGTMNYREERTACKARVRDANENGMTTMNDT